MTVINPMLVGNKNYVATVRWLP